MSTLRKPIERLLNEDDVHDRNVKVRINTYIDFDIVKTLKKEAKKKKIGYQTLLNQKLREVIFSEKDFVKRIAKIEQYLHIAK